MNWFVIIGILISVSIPSAFADYRGEDYLDVDNGDGTHTWTGGLSPWVYTGQIDSYGNKIYAHYIIDDQSTYVKVTNGEASFVFDKTTCSAKIYDGGLIEDQNGFILDSDSYVPKVSVDGSGIWSIVNSVNNASCVTEIIETENSIEVSGTKQSSAGIFKIRYLKEEGKQLKTMLEATNLTALTDRRFGVTQTQSIPQIIIWAGQQRDLGNYVGQTFDRQWLENNKANLSNLFIYNSLQFDVIDAWDNLESISVNSVSNGIASISFNYLRNAPILLPNETLIIDPTFGYASGTVKTIADTGCNLVADSADASGYAGGNSGPTTCYNSAYYFDITSIPDASYIATVSFRSDTIEINDAVSASCAVKSIEGNVSTMTDQQIEDDIRDGTLYTTLTTDCRVIANNYIVSTASMATDLQAELGVDNEWALGIYQPIYAFNMARIVVPELEVIYFAAQPPGAVTVISTTSITYTVIGIDWDAPSAGGGSQTIIGYQINASSPWSDNPTVFLNDTGTTLTAATLSGLLSGSDYSIRVSAWTNNTADHPLSNTTGTILNATTVGNASAETINETIGVIGDTARLTGFVNITAGGSQTNLTSVKIIRNGTLLNTNSTIQNSTGTPYGINVGPFWINLPTADVYEIEIETTLQNTVESITNSTSFFDSREYDPDYSPAVDNPATQGNVNATVVRFDDEDGILLKVNRQGVSTGDTWQIECIAQTNSEAAQTKDETASWNGDWSNTTNTGYFNTTFTGYLNSHAYITCFNEDELFSLTSFTNSSLALLGIELFDQSYGSMIGVPVGIFFLVMTAGMANKRTAPTFIIVITGIAGTMATIGFFSFEPIVWGLALVTAMLGIFVNQKIF